MTRVNPFVDTYGGYVEIEGEMTAAVLAQAIPPLIQEACSTMQTIGKIPDMLDIIIHKATTFPEVTGNTVGWKFRVPKYVPVNEEENT